MIQEPMHTKSKEQALDWVSRGWRHYWRLEGSGGEEDRQHLQTVHSMQARLLMAMVPAFVSSAMDSETFISPNSGMLHVTQAVQELKDNLCEFESRERKCASFFMNYCDSHPQNVSSEKKKKCLCAGVHMRRERVFYVCAHSCILFYAPHGHLASRRRQGCYKIT